MPTTHKSLHTDGISTSDQDELERVSIANAIAENILHHIENSSDSIVLGIHGPWGSGKSNLLYYIKEKVKKHTRYVDKLDLPKKNLWKRFTKEASQDEKKLYVMEFNPWIFSGKEQLHYAFLNEFAAKIGSKDQKLREKIKTISKRFRWLEEVGWLGRAAKSVSEDFSDVSIEQLKSETNKILADEHTHVVIIIDDVDRLTPVEMLEVFQLIKLNANFANTLFVISFDKDIVSKAIKNTLNFDGDEYLEKIIQVDYSLPSIADEKLEELFFKMLKYTLGEEVNIMAGSLSAPWLMHGLRTYFRNIRDLKRFFNALAFRFPSVQEHIDLHDFILIEAIRLFDFPSYERIRDHYKESLQFTDREYHNQALARMPDGTKELYSYLLVNGRRIALSVERRYPIHDPEFFDRYFTFSVSKLDIRENEFKNFALYPPTRESLLISLIQSNKIDFLLRRIEAKAKETNIVNQTGAIGSLISVWSRFRYEFTIYWRTVWNATTAMLEVDPDQNGAFRSLFDEVTVSTSEFSPARFVFLWLILENIYREDEKNLDPHLSRISELLAGNKQILEGRFAQMLESNYTNFFFNSTYEVLYRRIFFPSFARLNPTKHVEQFGNLVSNDNSLVDFIRLSVQISVEAEPVILADRQFLRSSVLPESQKIFYEKLNNLNLNILPEVDAAAITIIREYIQKSWNV